MLEIVAYLSIIFYFIYLFIYLFIYFWYLYRVAHSPIGDLPWGPDWKTSFQTIYYKQIITHNIILDNTNCIHKILNHNIDTKIIINQQIIWT